MIGAAIFALLSPTTLAETRVYPLQRPQGSELPAITYQVISTTPLHAFARDAGVFTVRVQVDSWAETYIGARQLANEVRGILSRWRGAAGQTEILDVLMDNELETAEGSTKRILQDYRIYVRE